MKRCPHCGHENDRPDTKCPACGKYYSKVLELIAEEEENEQLNSFRGRLRHILDSENRKQALITEVKAIKSNLSSQAKFALFVIFVFIFALMISVL